MDVFWRTIMKRITDAKAVIVIWSPPALDSEWVYAEASLAHEQGKQAGQAKLICLCTEDVSPATVPLPFNGMNVSPIDDRARVFASLEAMGVPTTATGGFKAPADDPVLSAPAIASSDREAGEIALAWQEIRDSDDAEDFDLFLAHYGDEHAFFARMAEKRRAKLRGVAVPVGLPETQRTGTVVALPTAKAKAELDAIADDVQLRIEPGMHTVVIKRISLTADGRVMATASDDKTVRLWALPEGRLVRTLRPPIGAGNDGKVYAVAIAPDGAWVAAGGWTASGVRHFVTIFDAATGRVTARLGPLPNVINDLEVSPDGQRLAAGLGGSNGVRVWARDTGDWRLAYEDIDYGGRVYGLSFARDGRLAATCEDGYVRLCDRDGGLAAKAKAPGGSDPYGIAFSPDGRRIAVGYTDSTCVDVLDAASLTPLFAAETSGIDNGDLSSVAWSADGARLAAAGLYNAGGQWPIVVWDEGGQGARRTIAGPENTVMDVAPWRDGFAFGAGAPAFGLVNGDDTRVLYRGPPMADLRGKRGEHFRVSPDGRRVWFGLKASSDAPVLLDLAGPAVTAMASAPGDLVAPETETLSIKNWLNATDPALDGAPLALRPYERVRSLAIAPDANSFVLGADWRLRRFDADGDALWEQPVPGAVWGVNLARDGRLAVAAYGDGTIRWHRADDGSEVLACFLRVDWEGGEPELRGWVLWTPEGYYTCAPGSEDLVGWHVNRGEDEAADFYPASTFAHTFHKPDIVARALDGV